MALSVASTSSNMVYNSNTVTVTKPTGLAEGDFMVAVSFGYQSGSSTPDLPTGWTSISTDNSTAVGNRLMYKEADSSDVAATNFTFTINTTSENFGAVIMRIASDDSSVIGLLDESDLTPTDLKQRTGGVIVAVNKDSGSIQHEDKYTGYTISGTNPTWTQQYEKFNNNDYIVDVATAVCVSDSDITSFSVSTGTISHGGLTTFAEVTNAAGTTALLSVQPTFLGIAGTSNTAGTVDILSVSSSLFDITGRVKNPVWTDQEKPSTPTWTNQERP